MKGVIRSAVLSPQISERRPSIAGDTASPSAWMKKMLTAKAIALTEGPVTLTIVVLSGPVLKKRKNSAKKIAVRQPVSEEETMAYTAMGVPARNPTPDTIKYPLPL